MSDEPLTISALYVEADGVYAGLEGVDMWPESRDARLYPGPWPVVAHPPCNVWCQLASVNHTRWGTPIGDDGGCFAAALASVRRWGGVLEHPAYSLAWRHHGLPVPRRGGWTMAFDDPGMTTEISQAAYGHDARKNTWLYTVGVDPAALDWRRVRGTAMVGAGVNTGQGAGTPRSVAPNRTPPAFRAVLLELARSVEMADV